MALPTAPVTPAMTAFIAAGPSGSFGRQARTKPPKSARPSNSARRPNSVWCVPGRCFERYRRPAARQSPGVRSTSQETARCADMARCLVEVESGRRYRSRHRARPRCRSVSWNEASFNVRDPLAELADIPTQLAHIIAQLAHVVANSCFPSIEIADDARLHRLHVLAKARLHRADVVTDLSLEAEHQSCESHADREHGSEQREQLGRPTVASCHSGGVSCSLELQLHFVCTKAGSNIAKSLRASMASGNAQRRPSSHQ